VKETSAVFIHVQRTQSWRFRVLLKEPYDKTNTALLPKASLRETHENRSLKVAKNTKSREKSQRATEERGFYMERARSMAEERCFVLAFLVFLPVFLET
jgi:hypothetical protein